MDGHINTKHCECKPFPVVLVRACGCRTAQYVHNNPELEPEAQVQRLTQGLEHLDYLRHTHCQRCAGTA